MLCVSGRAEVPALGEGHFTLQLFTLPAAKPLDVTGSAVALLATLNVRRVTLSAATCLTALPSS
jgi:hypothetical protein